ncbi:unnamed protein product [Paramecium sonneborni]|uniref:Uncharacterized protein n=1 Tax=Paramecium sonneborni TaxID=65129 RepID=A0A8S1LWA0_9CILI|nr:unnamed protein product [Paramecium sonneborni]
MLQENLNKRPFAKINQNMIGYTQIVVFEEKFQFDHKIFQKLPYSF